MKLYHADVLQTGFLTTLSDRLLSEAKSGVGEGLLLPLGMKVVPHYVICLCDDFVSAPAVLPYALMAQIALNKIL